MVVVNLSKNCSSALDVISHVKENGGCGSGLEYYDVVMTS